jgi:hypothetical protein
MALVEVDETELSNLRGIQQVLAQVEKHPEARAMAQKAVALAAPERAGPEVKIRGELDEFRNEIKGVLTTFVDEQKAAREENETATARRALETRWMEGRQKARAAGYNNEEGLNALEKFMEEKGVADHEVAIPAFERLHPPPEPLMTGGNRWDFFAPAAQQAPDLKPLFDGNEDAFLGPAIQNAIMEVRNNR